MTWPRDLYTVCCRTSSRVRVTCGRLPSLCGRSWRSLVSVRSKLSPTTRSSTTVPAAVLVISWTWCSVSRPTVRVRSTTLWSSAGTVSRSTGRRSARFTCSCSARTWDTRRRRSTQMMQGCRRLRRSSHSLRHRHRPNCWEYCEIVMIDASSKRHRQHFDVVSVLSAWIVRCRIQIYFLLQWFCLLSIHIITTVKRQGDDLVLTVMVIEYKYSTALLEYSSQMLCIINEEVKLANYCLTTTAVASIQCGDWKPTSYTQKFFFHFWLWMSWCIFATCKCGEVRDVRRNRWRDVSNFLAAPPFASHIPFLRFLFPLGSPLNQLEGLGDRCTCKFSSGVWGGTPAKNEFGALYNCQKATE